MDLLHEISIYIIPFFYNITSNIVLILISIALVCFILVLIKKKTKKIKSLEDAKKRTRVLKVFYYISIIFFVITFACLIYSLLYDLTQSVYEFPEEDYSAFERQENEYFNNQFESYSGYQTGSNVSSLLVRLSEAEKKYCSNSKKEIVVVFNQLRSEERDIEITYNESTIVNSNYHEINKVLKTISSNNIVVIPDFEYDEVDGNYLQTLAAIRRNIENKHTYNVSFSYQENGLIDVIMISYFAEIPMEEVHREELINK